MRVTEPDLKRSKPFKDFGQGFYLSAEEQQAKDQAISKVDQMKSGQPTTKDLSHLTIMTLSMDRLQMTVSTISSDAIGVE